MAKPNKITQMPPAMVEMLIKRLGRNLKTARLRRKLTLEALAARIGISRYLLSDVEKGKTSASIAAFIGALWALGLTDTLKDVANPAFDQEGLALENKNASKTAPKRHRILDNDF